MFTLDTNLLVYVVDSRAPAKTRSAIEILELAAGVDCVLTVQAVAEFYHVATRKFGVPPDMARRYATSWFDLFPCVNNSRGAVEQAMEASARGRFSFWDALLLATAEQAGCSVCLSEDMRDGARLGHLVVRQAFERDGTLSKAARAVLTA